MSFSSLVVATYAAQVGKAPRIALRGWGASAHLGVEPVSLTVEVVDLVLAGGLALLIGEGEELQKRGRKLVRLDLSGEQIHAQLLEVAFRPSAQSDAVWIRKSGSRRFTRGSRLVTIHAAT
ncbi:hypothetical protein SZ60_03150 [Frigoribacterium sp. MEB024]|nr:hypothetical protein SZ60_03150 [Frigoribacterium sp. MEB024]